MKGVVGIFELGKLGSLDTYVSEIMNEPASITNSTKIIEAIHLIVELGYRNLPVVDENGKLVGIVTRASIVDSIYNNIIGGEADD